MTRLQKHALGVSVMTDKDVEKMHSVKDIKDYPNGSAITAMRRVCESHERLRSEVQGAEIVMADYEREVKELKAALKSLCEYAAASRETNTKEFMQELADRMNAAAKAMEDSTAFVWHHDLATGELWFTTVNL